jgi:hypothetical protein
VSDQPAPRPYPEARPPHLPDVLTRQSPWAFAFAAIAVIQVVAALQRTWQSDVGLIDYSLLVSLLIPSAIVPLLGVAVFVRQPEARRTMPLLVFGLAVLCGTELLTHVDGRIYEFLAGPELDVTSPGVVAYGVFKSLLRLFGILYVGAGIAAARQVGAWRGQRLLTFWLVAVAVIGIVLGPLGVVPATADLTVGDLIGLILGVILALLVSLAWAYLASVTVGGALAGEVPRGAWKLGAVAVATLFALRVISGVLIWLGEAGFTIGTITSYLSLAAWLLLIVAFATGLPTPAAVDATDDPPAATQPGSAAG